jgi:subtilase family serine protease
MALGRFSSVMNVSGEFITTNGTSFSAPITAGLVASLWQALPHLKNNELLQLIKENSSLFQNPTYQMGYGIPCFFCAYEQALSSENVHLSDAVIFPNPFQNQINIILDESQNLPSKLRIKNSLGQVIFEKLIYDNQSQLELNISKGLYFYEIEQGNKIFKSKIIKK